MARPTARLSTSSLLLLFALLALLAAPLGALAAGPTIGLADPVNYIGNVYPADVALGDLNHDGWLDMVVADSGASGIRVRLGDGAGGFGGLASVYYVPKSARPMAVTLADLNGDGDLDAATANRDGNSVSVLMGDGTGALGASTQYAVGNLPQWIDAGDLDNDGDIDLVVSINGHNMFGILTNDGAGAFVASTVICGDAPQGIRLVDVNNDGWLDVVVVVLVNLPPNQDVLNVFLNDGTGGYTTGSTNYPIGNGEGAYDVQPADLNNDGWPDLVFGGANLQVLVMLNEGGGTFGSAASHEALGQTQRVLPVDLNGDGILDLVATDATNAQLVVYPGAGDGSFGAPVTFAATSAAENLAVGDINRDAKPDLVVCDSKVSGVVSVYLNDTDLPATTLGAAVSYALATDANPWDVAFGDLDGDGRLDMVVTESAYNRVGVRLGVGDGTFGLQTNYSSGNVLTAIVIADLDRDGDLDVAVSNRGSHNVSVLLGDGTGGLGAAFNYAVGGSALYLAAGDVDNDGDLDLVSANELVDTVSVILNAGDGTFGAASNYTVGDQPMQVVLADLNRDGWLDMAVTNYSDHDVSVLLNNKAGGFNAALDYPAGTRPYGMTVGDFNADGAPDLAVANYLSASVSVLLNDGGGAFASAVNYAVGSSPRKVVAVDLNRDGVLDLAVTNLANNNVSVLTGVGDGTFGAQTTFAVGTSPIGITSADLNRDGKPDLAVANYSGSTVSVLLGEEEGPALQITKAVTPADPSWGEALTYTIQISNTGNMAATGVLVTDTFPSDYVSDVAVSSAGLAITNTATGATWGWTVEDMAPGALGTITLTGVLTDYITFGEVFTNTVEIGCAEGVTATASAEATVGSDCVPTFTVISNADSGPGTLRQGLQAICDGGVIDFDLTTPATITLTSGHLAADTRCTILGPGAEQLAISGDDTFQILVASAPLAISGLTLRDGSTTGDGGAINTSKALTLESLTLLNNSADNGGAVYCDISETMVISGTRFISNTATTSSGAFHATGDVTITGSLFQGNQTLAGDYGVFYSEGDVTLRDSRFEANRASGAIGVFSTMGRQIDIAGCVFADNSAGVAVGAIFGKNDIHLSESLIQGNSAALIGGVAVAGSAYITGTEFYSNTATTEGGALYLLYGGATISGGTFQGNTAGTLGGGIVVSTPASLLLDGVTLRENSAVEAGGGVWANGSTWITDSLFVGNVVTGTDSLGGGLYLEGLGGIANSTFQGNDSRGMGGGIALANVALGSTAASLQGSATVSMVTISNTSVISNTARYGGGGLVSDGAELAMYDSTVAHNVSADGNRWGAGGGIQLMDVPSAQLINCTIAYNSAGGTDDDGGGGILVYDLGGANTALGLGHCTIVGNSSASNGGGLLALGTGAPTFVMTNTLVAGNTALGGSSPDIKGMIVSSAGNVVGDATGSTGLSPLSDQYGSALSPLDALTGALGDYGGDTLTIPLLPGSPAINYGTELTWNQFDQRGVVRLWPDAGAFESQGFGLAIISGSGQSTPVGSAFLLPLVAGVTSAYGEPVDGGQVQFTAPQLGPSATMAPNPATIIGGQASTIATANDIVGGPYDVLPSMLPPSVKVSSLQGAPPKFVLTNLVPMTAEGAYRVGPATVCPGYNTYHTLVISNTSTSLAMEGLVVTGTVPAEVEFYGDMSPAGGAYDALTGEIVWSLPSLAAGQQALIQWTTHVLNGTPTGTIITSTASWSSDLLPGETLTTSVTVDNTGCGPTPPADLIITGHVFSGSGAAEGDPIAGAVVTATTCVAGQWVDVTDEQGRYTITIPGQVAEACETVTLVVTAQGYGEGGETFTIADLRDDNVRDFLLDPWYYTWLPLLFR